MESEDDTVAQLNSPWTVRVNCDDLLEIQVDGTEGSAVVGLRDCKTQGHVNTPKPEWNPSTSKEYDFYEDWTGVPNNRVFESAFKFQREKFIRHVVADEPFPQDFTAGARGVQLTEASYRSSEEGRHVVLDGLSVQKGPPTNSFMSNSAIEFHIHIDGGESPVSWLSAPEDVIPEACGNPSLPELGIIEQVWETNPIPTADVPEAVAKVVAVLSFAAAPEDGEVALGVGSRGTVNIPDIAADVVDAVSEVGYEPFVFPTMGSHDGVTGDRQREMLNEFGITGERIGCEIRSSVEVVGVGRTPDRDVPVVADANTANVDAIIPVNRVKPHTDFDGEIESGLSKVLVIGMGKQRSAQTVHKWTIDWSFRQMIPEIIGQSLDSLPIVGGVAIAEDQHNDTTLIEGVSPSGFLDREHEPLETAYELMPKLPFEELDLVMFDRQGKEVSGQGMDTNVTGRRSFSINKPAPGKPNIKCIYTHRLAEKIHGNATGVGSANAIHEGIVAELDAQTTLINALTASTIRGVKLPSIVKTDRAGVVAALSTIGVVESDTIRVVRVADTMYLHRPYASSAPVGKARERDDLRAVEDPAPIAFEDGQLAVSSF